MSDHPWDRGGFSNLIKLTMDPLDPWNSAPAACPTTQGGAHLPSLIEKGVTEELHHNKSQHYNSTTSNQGFRARVIGRWEDSAWGNNKSRSQASRTAIAVHWVAAVDVEGGCRPWGHQPSNGYGKDAHQYDADLVSKLLPNIFWPKDRAAVHPLHISYLCLTYPLHVVLSVAAHDCVLVQACHALCSRASGILW